MVDILKRLIPDFTKFQEQQLGAGATQVGYQSVLITKDRFPYAGGTAADLNTARRICAAEAIERAHFQMLQGASSERRAEFGLDKHPTTCGFAAGFESYSTLFRSICEAVERWAWSKWVDEKHSVPNLPSPKSTQLACYFANEFDEIHYFQNEIVLNDVLRPPFIPNRFIFSAVVGRKGSGIFPGSRVTTSKDCCWEHPLLEAWRHLKIFQNEPLDPVTSNIFDRRILYFGKNGSQMICKLKSFEMKPWPPATLNLVREVASMDGYFVWRALCENFMGWERGDETRFIY